ncbi:MAG: DNA/RNA-binding protein AlbA [Candidatus Pacearchaeota archaeon]|nr:DNA/RNA-binding protein AlbA [Candidatus Pacearchaeota archaeon]
MAETKNKKDDNIVFIGGKPFMNYVRAVEIQFGTNNNKEVIIKSRGKFISRAVDVEQVIKHGPLGQNVETKRIETNSEEFENQEGRKVKVSTIEITLAKK